MDEETGGFDIELLTDVFPDLDEVAAAVAAGAGLRFVAMFNARQFRRQGIAAGSFVLTRRGGRGLLLFQFGDDGCTILIAGFDKQIPLLAGQGFARVTEADAPMVREFEGELLDLQFAPLEFGVAFDKLKLQCRDLRLDPIRQD
jgi:hypothetical protein